MAETDERFYKGNTFTSVKKLENRCEKDETDLFMALTSLELGIQSGKDGTIGTFEESDETNLGELIFEEYDDEAEANLLKTGHELDGAEELFRGVAQIGTKQKNVIVFRSNGDQ